MNVRQLIGSILVSGLVGVVAYADSPTPSAMMRPLTVVGTFEGADGVAADLSGIACSPPATDASRLCLLVDDEVDFAQWATLSGDTLTVGGKVALKLVEPHDRPAAYRTSCPEKKIPRPEKQDVDGEAVTYAAPYFYVTGSHGCSRRKGKYSDRAFAVYRIRPGASGSVASSSGVKAEMNNAPELRGRVERALDEVTGGATVEGLAATGDDLLIGFRAPNLNGDAVIMTVRRDGIFGTGPADRRIRKVAVGPARGVRDMAALPDGRLIVLSGPAQDQSGTFRLQLIEPSGRILPLPGWSRPAAAGAPKAEALTVLASSPKTVELLMVFEAAPNGAPTIVSLPIPPRMAG